MKRWLKDREEDLVQLENRYTVTVELIVSADSMDDAEADVVEMIQEGILATFNESDDIETKILQYNVTDIEPAEVF